MSTEPKLYHWLCLTGAILTEVAGTVVMKMSHGWAFPYAAQVGLVGMLALVALSYYMLALSTTALPVGVAFACWEGLGLSLITLSSVFVVGEQMSLTRFLALCCVMGGVMLIHRGTSHGDKSDEEESASSTTLREEQGDEAHALLTAGGK